MIKGFFFFFQAEDGIRDGTVTGVQTCALPIYGPARRSLVGTWASVKAATSSAVGARPGAAGVLARSGGRYVRRFISAPMVTSCFCAQPNERVRFAPTADRSERYCQGTPFG